MMTAFAPTLKEVPASGLGWPKPLNEKLVALNVMPLGAVSLYAVPVVISGTVSKQPAS